MTSPDTLLQRSSVELLEYFSKSEPSALKYALLVTSASRNWDTVLINVDPKTGALLFEEDSEHVFGSAAQAKARLQKQGRTYIKKAGKYVLGCAVVNTHAWFLLATDIDSKPAVKLPGSHYVFNVTGAEWVSARLQVPAANPELEYRYGEMLAEFPVAGYHYFCETADISRPFPSSHAVTAPSWEFVWNYYLTQPFRAAGLPGAAPHLLQGLAEARTLPDIHGNVFDVVLLARRSRLHAGTRYKARGLNAAAAPANEIEVEQLVLRDGGAQWSGYVWRRGSVPLHWRQTVKGNGVGTAIAIEPERTFQGSRRYFRRVQMRYYQNALPPGERAPDGRLTAAQRAASREYPVAIVNLLRKGSIDRDRSEAKLYSAFCDLMTALRTDCGLNIINLGLDWHELSAQHNELAPVVQILWGAAGQHYRDFGFSAGTVVDGAAGDGAGAGGSAWGPAQVAVATRRQAGVFRINCADSLDRTNVASYYSAFQVLLEQCRALGLAATRYRSTIPAARLATAGGVADAGKPGRGMQRASKMLGSFASRMGTMAQGLVVNPGAGPGPLGASGKRDTASDGSNGAAAAADDANATALVPRGDLLAADGSWWEKRVVGWPKDAPTETRNVYVNHTTRATSWTPPPAWNEWEFLKQPVENVRHLVMPQLLVAYKDLFRVSGDKNAELYTGSPAMHSSQLDLLASDSLAGHGVAGFFNNATTAMTRRFKNIMTDERTHSIFERFLGLPVSSGAAAGGGGDAPSHGVAAELAAAAQALPACDDADSDDGGDVLAARQWPTRGLASPGRGGGPDGALPEEAEIVTAVEPDAPEAAAAPPPAADPLAPAVASHRTASFSERVSAAVDAAGPDLLALDSPKAAGAAAAADRDDAAVVYGADASKGGGTGSAQDNPFGTPTAGAPEAAVRSHDPFADADAGGGGGGPFVGFASSANGGSRGGGEEWSDGHLGSSLL